MTVRDYTQIGFISNVEILKHNGDIYETIAISHRYGHDFDRKIFDMSIIGFFIDDTEKDKIDLEVR